MDEKLDSAFPNIGRSQWGEVITTQAGMSLRDYFAAKAMQGIVGGSPIALSVKYISECAYKVADAMLAARNGNANG